MVITSKENQYIHLVNELKKKKYRDKYGMFIAEGKRLIEDLCGSDLMPHLILYAEDFTDIAFLEKVCHKADHVFAVSRKLFDKISETCNDQGMIAVFPVLCPELKHFTPEENSLIFILNGVSDPGNLGTIVRSSAAANVAAILMEEGCVDLYNPKVIRSTMGTVAKIPIFHGLEYEEIRSFLNSHEVTTYLADMHEAVCYDELPEDKKVAVVLGNEGNGISDNWRGGSYRGVMIPMENGVESLNVAMAAGIIAFDHHRKVRKNLK
ncbi:MAG: RNA methyltransferase [Firmicutes bacterium]|nr:RNA methyltransferase [Bacillota bacterium]